MPFFVANFAQRYFPQAQPIAEQLELRIRPPKLLAFVYIHSTDSNSAWIEIHLLRERKVRQHVMWRGDHAKVSH